MSFWYPQTLYKKMPLVYFLLAVFIFFVWESTLGKIIAALLCCYAGYITVMRFLWKDTGRID